MSFSPRVSIVVPLFDDEQHVRAALESCLAQTLPDIEIICVDDASTDMTADIVANYQESDPRIKLIRQGRNLSAFQARRAGVLKAASPFVLFLDGDDELAPHAAQTLLSKALSERADVVGFGVDILTDDGNTPKRFENALQPRHTKLVAPNIIPSLFPVGQEVNGHLWRYLFATDLLLAAYDGVSPEQSFYRANDLPITFLALAHAEKYVSTNERLYRYHFRRGTSGHSIDGVEHFKFLLSGIAPISSVASRVDELAASTGSELLSESYENARLHIIGNVLKYCMRDTNGALQLACLDLLQSEVGKRDMVRAAADFCPQALPALSKQCEVPDQPSAPVRSVLLTTANLDVGGLQTVLLHHASQLVDAGIRVTIAVLRDATTELDLPSGIEVEVVSGNSKRARLDHWLSICAANDVDIVIDHHILYNENWPWFALAALSQGIPTIGWIHNFALRPIFDQVQRTSFLALHMRVLLRVVTLSPTDVAFWKLLGLERIVYIPNPPTPLTIRALERDMRLKNPGKQIELAWWGRLDRSTKQVHHLLEMAEELHRRDIEFRLTIIGPDSRNLRADELRSAAEKAGLGGLVKFLPSQTPEELLSTLKDTDLLVSSSLIEGYQLTIIEAQALGMPVVMYDLPWLATVQSNPGVVTTPPGDPAALAEAVAAIANDKSRYEELATASKSFARTMAALEIGPLLVDLLNGRLAAEYSPAPGPEASRILLEWMVRYAERNIRSANRGSVRGNSEVSKLRRERDRARKELRHVMDGPSFRIGRALTAVPRRVKMLLGTKKRSAPHSHTPAKVETKQRSDAPAPLTAAPHSPRPLRSTNPDVTVVVPVYNSEPWLEACLTSVLAQTGVDLELICINDGSTDQSRLILQRFADADPRVTIVDQENSGQSVGRNVGLEAAKGKYLVYLDSDDYWPEDALAALVKAADADELDVLLFDCVAFRDGDVDESTWRRYENYYQRKHEYAEVRSGISLMTDMRYGKDYRPHVGLYLARIDFAREIGLRFIPGIVHQDNPYTFRLLLNARRAAHRRVNFYARRLRPGSTITSLNAERSARGYFLSYLEMNRELANLELSVSDYSMVANILNSAYGSARKQFALLSEAEAETIGELDLSADAQVLFNELRTNSSPSDE